MLAGRPYHVDPEINHGIDRLITPASAAAGRQRGFRPGTWQKQPQCACSTSGRITPGSTRAAAMSPTQPDMKLVQLVSFGCGVDAITTDEVRDILEASGQVLHADQDRRNHQPGRGAHPPALAVRRHRPAAGARRPKRKEGLKPPCHSKCSDLEFTREMREAGYTILVPNMLEFHFSLIVKVLRLNGYNAELLTNSGPNVMAEGLKYVHNDTCVPALLVIGQFLDALHSGKYDINKVALIITQTGGGCRASNYIYLLRKALKKAGLEQVPVISVNMSGLESASGFKLTLPLVRQIVASLVYGDCIMCVSNQTRPYELEKGTTDALIEKWNDALIEQFNRGQGLSNKAMRQNLAAIVDDFDAIERSRETKTRVGVVGEIYVKYSSLGNNGLEKFLRTQDCEYMLPGIMGFVLFKIDNRIEDHHLYGGSLVKLLFCKALMKFCERMETTLIEAVAAHPNFVPPTAFRHIKALVKGVIGYGSKMGEGWLLTAEMLELAENGHENIICAQPFGCLPNHICGKGMIRRLTQVHPGINIVPIDYDLSATKVNQENRIRLMLAVAHDADAKRREQEQLIAQDEREGGCTGRCEACKQHIV
ncbi:MAG: 2-hydroxyglutaryl-CoA dehydratase [Christensenellales bacterium]